MRTFAIALATVATLSSVANAANCGCPVPVKASATVKVSASAGVPRPEACRTDGKYYRAQNDLFEKYDYMTVCDASQGIGAVNVKKDDGQVGKTTRPGSGPLYLNGCVVTLASDVGKRAYNQSGTAMNGCRVALNNVIDGGTKLVFVIEGKQYVDGFFGLKAYK